ncbi:hypothetical protein AO269_27665 [Pseudomonas putida]|nr:hypothetical protein AO269_27665 [Pseudomonas putida]
MLLDELQGGLHFRRVVDEAHRRVVVQERHRRIALGQYFHHIGGGADDRHGPAFALGFVHHRHGQGAAGNRLGHACVELAQHRHQYPAVADPISGPIVGIAELRTVFEQYNMVDVGGDHVTKRLVHIALDGTDQVPLVTFVEIYPKNFHPGRPISSRMR